MKIQDIIEIARKKGVKVGKMNKIDLVRAIQKAEGDDDCFATNNRYECNKTDCFWREYCMKAV